MDDKDLIRDIHSHVIKLVEQGARHNEILDRHEVRSTNLERIVDALVKRLSPIEKHVDLVSLVLKALGAIVVAIAIQGLVKAIF